MADITNEELEALMRDAKPDHDPEVTERVRARVFPKDDRSEPPPGYSVEPLAGDEYDAGGEWSGRADIPLTMPGEPRSDAVDACWAHRDSVLASAGVERGKQYRLPTGALTASAGEAVLAWRQEAERLREKADGSPALRVGGGRLEWASASVDNGWARVPIRLTEEEERLYGELSRWSSGWRNSVDDEHAAKCRKNMEKAKSAIVAHFEAPTPPGGGETDRQRLIDCIRDAFAWYCRQCPDPDHFPEGWAEEAQDILGGDEAEHIYDYATREGAAHPALTDDETAALDEALNVYIPPAGFVGSTLRSLYERAVVDESRVATDDGRFQGSCAVCDADTEHVRAMRCLSCGRVRYPWGGAPDEHNLRGIQAPTEGLPEGAATFKAIPVVMGGFTAGDEYIDGVAFMVSTDELSRVAPSLGLYENVVVTVARKGASDAEREREDDDG